VDIPVVDSRKEEVGILAYRVVAVGRIEMLRILMLMVERRELRRIGLKREFDQRESPR